MKHVLHYPRLDTILMVEDVLRTADEPLSKNEIDRRLARQVMRPTLNLILKYLEQGGKIALLKEGVLWICKEDVSAALTRKLDSAVTVIRSGKRSSRQVRRTNVQRVPQASRSSQGRKTITKQTYV